MTTLDELAKLSGVSRATASRVLNRDPRVREATRVRVLDVAAQIGYQPNRAARSLASGRSHIIGLVLPTEQLVSDPYGAALISAVANAAGEQDQQLMLWLTREEPNATVRGIFRDGLVDGLVVSAPALRDQWVEDLFDGPLPTVLVGGHPKRTDVNVVDSDNAGGAQLAVEHLVAGGHTRIATITGPLDRVDGQARLDAFRAALRTHGLAVDERLISHGDYTPTGGLAAMVRLLPHLPSAVFAASDQMALGAYEAIEAAGRRVPEDIAVVGFDGFAEAATASPPLTTVRQDFEAIGRHAVDTLLAAATSPDGAPRQVTVPVELIVRGSSTRD